MDSATNTPSHVFAIFVSITVLLTLAMIAQGPASWVYSSDTVKSIDLEVFRILAANAKYTIHCTTSALVAIGHELAKSTFIENWIFCGALSAFLMASVYLVCNSFFGRNVEDKIYPSRRHFHTLKESHPTAPNVTQSLMEHPGSKIVSTNPPKLPTLAQKLILAKTEYEQPMEDDYSLLDSASEQDTVRTIYEFTIIRH
jgi:hypothetical protein